MKKNTTVKNCVLNILKVEPNLSNQEIADKVRLLVDGAKTTAQNIAWYKWDFTNKNEMPELNISIDDDVADLVDIYGDAIDENTRKDWEKAEEIVAQYERKKGNKIEKVNYAPGYELFSINPNGQKRHIEIKSQKKGKKTWISLTSNQTDCLLNEPDFWLYILEGDISSGLVQIVEIPRIELLKSVKIKLHGRISNLLGHKRIDFKYSVK